MQCVIGSQSNSGDFLRNFRWVQLASAGHYLTHRTIYVF